MFFFEAIERIQWHEKGYVFFQTRILLEFLEDNCYDKLITAWLVCTVKKSIWRSFQYKILAARASNLQILLLLFGEFKLISIPPEIRKKP